MERFLREGFYVVGMDRNSIGLRGIVPCLCDITNVSAISACVQDTINRYGRIDVLVNNAGICTYERMLESTVENWHRTFATNLEAMYGLTRLVVPHMIQRGYGRIVNISSTQSIAAESTVGAYAATKGAINAWSRSLAVDLAEYGILVNAVAPGCIHTGMSIVQGVDETKTEDFQEWYVRRRKIPLARSGRPEEIADVIFFLSGDQCTYITGQVLVVDGGLTVTF
ncbi:3-oxoacyl-[acyl-carrier-protein] reductase [soil metagenome]